MKFFVDTADINEIKELKEYGLIDGVTTNPSLILKSGRDFTEVITEIAEECKGLPVSAEVIATDAEGMIKEGMKVAEISNNIVVKLPLTMEGLKACKHLSSLSIKTNVTLCFSANQALLAAKAGATYISPFVGRLDDLAQDGMDLIDSIVTIYNNYGYETEVLVASIRSPEHVRISAELGADVATIPAKVIHQLAKHPLTDKGLEQFLKDWDKADTKI